MIDTKELRRLLVCPDAMGEPDISCRTECPREEWCETCEAMGRNAIRAAPTLLDEVDRLREEVACLPTEGEFDAQAVTNALPTHFTDRQERVVVVALRTAYAVGADTLTAQRDKLASALRVLLETCGEPGECVECDDAAAVLAECSEPEAEVEGMSEAMKDATYSHVDGRDLLAEVCDGAHHIDILVRRNGQDEVFEGDWLKRLKEARDAQE